MKETLHTAVVSNICKIERYEEAKIIAHSINVDAEMMDKMNDKAWFEKRIKTLKATDLITIESEEW
jgi:hypothetical protein